MKTAVVTTNKSWESTQWPVVTTPKAAVRTVQLPCPLVAHFLGVVLASTHVNQIQLTQLPCVV